MSGQKHKRIKERLSLGRSIQSMVYLITNCSLIMEELERQAELSYKSQRTGFLETIVFLKNEEIVNVLCSN